jgi:hypothetical protein
MSSTPVSSPVLLNQMKTTKLVRTPEESDSFLDLGFYRAVYVHLVVSTIFIPHLLFLYLFACHLE